MLQFDPEKHLYTYEGREVPSVTQVIGEWKVSKLFSGAEVYVNTFTGEIVPKSRFDGAADFGNAVHAGANLIVTGQGVNWDVLHPDIVQPLREVERWAADYGIETLATERAVYSKKHDYAGTFDWMGRMLKRKDALVIVDFKTGGHDMAGPQTAGYEIAVREEDGWRNLVERYVLYLPKNGGPYQFKKQQNRNDGAFFLARRFTLQHLKDEGLI